MNTEITERMLMDAIFEAVKVELITDADYLMDMINVRAKMRKVLEAALNEQ